MVFAYSLVCDMSLALRQSRWFGVTQLERYSRLPVKLHFRHRTPTTDSSETPADITATL